MQSIRIAAGETSMTKVRSWISAFQLAMALAGIGPRVVPMARPAAEPRR